MRGSKLRAWASRRGERYRRAMVPRVAPLPRAENLDTFEGMWVAIIDGEVVAAEHTSHALARKLHDMDHRKRDKAVIEFVRPTTDSYIVGAG